MPFSSTVLQPHPQRRQTVLSVLEAALSAVAPVDAVQTALRCEGDRLHVAERVYNLNEYRRIFVVGAGKAGAPMTRAVEQLLGDRLDSGLVVVKTGHVDEERAADSAISIVEASHPLPNAAGVAAGEQILALAEQATRDDLVIALLSGGGSALLVAPAPGLSLADLQAMTDALLASGADIREINCLRKHCSAVKGGQLARAVAPATLLTLVLSDVVGSPLDAIASGPTVPDGTTWADAWAIVERYRLEGKLPASIVARLQSGLAGEVADTPKPDDPLFANAALAPQTLIVADNRVAAEAARVRARALGFNTLLLSTFVEGEAREVAKVVAALAKEIVASGQPVSPPACLILGGETTVTLGEQPGRGGRNQALALAAALEIDREQTHALDDVTIVSLATDGTDGPTDSAGALVDSGTVARGRARGLNARDHLRRDDVYPFLQATNDLLLTGPTQTNVNDLIFVFVHG